MWIENRNIEFYMRRRDIEIILFGQVYYIFYLKISIQKYQVTILSLFPHFQNFVFKDKKLCEITLSKNFHLLHFLLYEDKMTLKLFKILKLRSVDIL